MTGKQPEPLKVIAGCKHIKTLSDTECSITALKDIMERANNPKPWIIWTTGKNLRRWLKDRSILSEPMADDDFYKLDIDSGSFERIDGRITRQYKLKQQTQQIYVPTREEYEES